MTRLRSIIIIITIGALLISLVSALTSDFTWEANLDCNSGLASSLETSRLLKLDKVIERDASFSRARDELAQYPEFLGRKRLFFGLLTTKKTVNDNGDITMKVCDSMFGINLLAFGETSFQSGMRQRDGLSTVVLARIPIVGGMLVCQDISNHNSNIDDDLGEICFRLTHSKSNEPQRNDQIELESRVIDYKPAISVEKWSKLTLVEDKMMITTRAIN
eukprot:scaffold844_cov268-Chaetoceros_neogracile.AAC.27